MYRRAGCSIWLRSCTHGETLNHYHHHHHHYHSHAVEKSCFVYSLRWTCLYFLPVIFLLTRAQSQQRNHAHIETCMHAGIGQLNSRRRVIVRRPSPFLSSLCLLFQCSISYPNPSREKETREERERERETRVMLQCTGVARVCVRVYVRVCMCVCICMYNQSINQ